MTTSSSKSWYGPWIWQALLIVAAGLWIFSSAFHGEWLMDDDLYLPKHPLLHDPDRLWKIWFAPGSFIEYYPIEETIQYLQWLLWGTDTLGYHLTNVILHIVNGLLVWRLLAKFGLRLAWLGGLIFVIHPVQVESVAWIAELKNTLSLTPFLVALGYWMDYEDQRKPRDYWIALSLFLVSMLCKITMAPFPFVILLYAWWKRRRIGWNDLLATVPFFIISLILGFTTIAAGDAFLLLHHTHPEPVSIGGLLPRLAATGLSIGFYFSQFFWPVGMIPLYPQWTTDPPAPRLFLPWPILIAGAVWCWVRRESWGRHVILGVGFFLLVLGPFLGLHGVSYMSFTRVMDHFLYIPIIGLIGLVIAALGDLSEQLPPAARLAGAALITMLLALMTWGSHAYVPAFNSRLEGYTYIIAHNPLAWAGHNNLGNALRKAGRIPEAMEQFREAARLKADYAEPRNNLGNLLMAAGRYPEAIAQFQEALLIEPDYPEALNGLGNTLALSGRLQEALPYYRAALKSAPDYAEAHNSLGNALLQLGQLDEAWAECEKAIQINPDYPEAHCTLGLILVQTGDVDGALNQFTIAAQLAPDNPHIQQGLVWLRGLKNEAQG